MDPVAFKLKYEKYENITQSCLMNLYLKYERREGIEYFLDKCSIKYNDPLIKNMRFTIDDRGNSEINNKLYTMCYNKTIPELEKNCGPDPFFHNWASIGVLSFFNTINDIIKESKKIPEIDKVGWVGNIFTPDDKVVEHHTRPLLKKIGDENNDILEIIHVDGLYKVLPIHKLPKYKYLIDIGGNGCSGRLKFLLFMRRPLLIVDRNYIEYFYKDLIPYTHYIPVKMDLSDLLEQVNWMRNNYEKSLEIANNAYDFAMSNFTLDKLLDRVYYVYKNLQ